MSNTDKKNKKIPLRQFIENKKGGRTVEEFVKDLDISKSVVDNIFRGRSPQVETLSPLLRAMLLKKRASPVEILSVLLGVSSEEIQKLDNLNEVEFSEIELSENEEESLKKKIETLAKELEYNTQKIEILLKSIPRMISLAIKESQSGTIEMFYDMVRKSLANTNSSQLRDRLEEDARNDPANALTWEEFEDILNGSLPKNVSALESFVAIIDPYGETYQASKWRSVWESEIVSINDVSQQHHIINGN